MPGCDGHITVEIDESCQFNSLLGSTSLSLARFGEGTRLGYVKGRSSRTSVAKLHAIESVRPHIEHLSVRSPVVTFPTDDPD